MFITNVLFACAGNTIPTQAGGPTDTATTPCDSDGILYEEDGHTQRVELDSQGLGWMVIETRGGHSYRYPYLPDEDGQEICEAVDWIQAREGPTNSNVVLDEAAGAWWRYYILAGVYNAIWYHYHGDIENPDVAELAEAIALYNEYLGVWYDPDKMLGNDLLVDIFGDIQAQSRVAGKTQIPVEAVVDEWLDEDPLIDPSDYQPYNSADRLQEDGAWQLSFRLTRVECIEETGWDLWGDDELYADGITILADSNGRIYDQYDLYYRMYDFNQGHVETTPQMNKTWPYDGTDENWSHLLPPNPEDPQFKNSIYLSWYEADFGAREDIDELLEKIRSLIEKLADKAIDAAVSGVLPAALDELAELADDLGVDVDQDKVDKAKEKMEETAEKHKDDVVDELLDFLGELLADDPFSSDMRLTHKLRVHPDHVEFSAWSGKVSKADVQKATATRDEPATIEHNGPHDLSYDDTLYFQVETDVTVGWMDKPEDPPGLSDAPGVEMDPDD